MHALHGMAPLVSAVAGLAMLASAAMAQMTSEDMGPAAFMWPKDRVWSAAADNTAPCGSIAGAGNRTLFPMRMHTRDSTSIMN